jgi:[acyl-carrier-protein] S-malonyltransferase
MKRVAFIFPGQGSQAIGMGKDFYENSEITRTIVDECSAKSGINFKELMFEPNGDLEKTKFTQPAILLVSAISLTLLREKLDIKNAYSLGHSLGEFTALYSVGGINLENVLRLVHNRGKFMAEACKNINAGMMAVIGLSNQKIDEVCKTGRDSGLKVWSANYNSDGQIVLAGIKTDLDKLSPQLKDAGAKRTLLLNMSVASHCELLESAVEKLKVELHENIIDIDFLAPIISNVSTREYNNRDSAIELLSKQLINPVKYSESIEYLADKVDIFVEFGHGSVLKGLNKRIVPHIPTISISDMATLQIAINELSKYFNKK